jgi:hypothetical protein
VSARPCALIGLAVWMLCVAGALAAKKTPQQFDANGDLQLSRIEFARYQIALRDPKVSEVDKDGDGDMSDTEKVAWAENFWLEAQRTAGGTHVAFEEALRGAPKPELKLWIPRKYVRLAKDHDELLKDDVEDADPATIGFYRNNLNGDDTWAFEAALGAVLPVYDSTGKIPPRVGNYWFDSVQFVPSVTLNRISGTGGGDLEEADSLEFRAGWTFAFRKKRDTNALWDTQFFSLNYRNSGATQGGRFTSAGEVEWEPVRSRQADLLAINGGWQAPRPWSHAPKTSPFKYRLMLVPRLEFGQTPFEATPDTFVKLGPKFGLTISPTAFDRLELFANYIYLWELNNNSGDFDLLETGARIALDPGKQIFIEGKYRLGEVPTKFTDIDLVHVALALKF